MTKNDLINALAEGTAVSKKDVEAIIDRLPGLIESTVKAGNPFTLPKVGIFKTKRVEAREARNPATGAMVDVPAKTKLTFKTAKAMADAIA